MKLLSAALLLAAALVLAQTPEERIRQMQRETLLLDTPRATYSADTVRDEAGIVHLRGHVRITTSAFTLETERAEYYRTIGRIDAHGEVRVRLLPGAH